jgi:hypothetical protein
MNGFALSVGITSANYAGLQGLTKAKAGKIGPDRELTRRKTEKLVKNIKK